MFVAQDGTVPTLSGLLLTAMKLNPICKFGQPVGTLAHRMLKARYFYDASFFGRFLL